MDSIYPILLGGILTVVHLVNEWIDHLVERYHREIISLSSGMFLAFIFLKLFSELSEMYNMNGIGIYLAFLIGFSLYHLISKYIYQHARTRKETRRELNELHFVGFTLDSIVTGIALILFLESTKFQDIIAIFLPFFFHTISMTMSFSHLHEKFKTHNALRFVFSFGPLLGVIIADLFLESVSVFHFSLAFLAGVVLYLAVRHMLPRGRRGSIPFYVIGVVLGTILLVLAL